MSSSLLIGDNKDSIPSTAESSTNKNDKFSSSPTNMTAKEQKTSQSKWHMESSWPSPVGGFRFKSAMAVVSPKSRTICSSGTRCTTLVMIGGLEDCGSTNSVQMMEIPSGANCVPKWRQGPPMNLPRWDFDAVVCNGAVYAIGGGTLAIERIKIEDLLKQHTTSMPGKTTESWCNLKCQLPVRPSHAGSTAVLKDRYIVVMTFGSRVRMQVLDTRDPDNHTLTLSRASYPNLVQRIGFTTIAVENRMYILGGKATSNYKALKLVECIEFATNDSANDPNKHVPGGESSCRILRPEFLSWKVETDLCLPHARYHHQAVVVGSKIVVAGGWDLNGKCAGSVEVVDVGQGETSELTKLNKPNNVNALLALPDSGRLLAVDTIFGTLETLQFGGDQENLETTRQGTIPKCEPSQQRSTRTGIKRPSKPFQKPLDGTSSKRLKKAPETNSKKPVNNNSVNRDNDNDEKLRSSACGTSGSEQSPGLHGRLTRMEEAVESIQGPNDLENRVQGLVKDMANRVKGLEDRQIKNLPDRLTRMEKAVESIQSPNEFEKRLQDLVKDMADRVKGLEDQHVQNLADRLIRMEEAVESIQSPNEFEKRLQDLVKDMVIRVKRLEDQLVDNCQVVERIQCLEATHEKYQDMDAKEKDSRHQQLTKLLEQVSHQLQCLKDKETTNQPMAERVSDERERHATEQKLLLARFDALEQKLLIAAAVDENQSRCGSNDTPQPTLPTDNGSRTDSMLVAKKKADVSSDSMHSSTLSLHPSNGSGAPVDEANHDCADAAFIKSMSKETAKTPDAVPNMTVQDRLGRLEATVLGSTMLYSAWILWNQWSC